MFVAERMASKKKTQSVQQQYRCLRNQGRKTQLWSRATHNDGPKKSLRGVNEKQNDLENNSSLKD